MFVTIGDFLESHISHTAITSLFLFKDAIRDTSSSQWRERIQIFRDGQDTLKKYLITKYCYLQK